ATRRCSTRSCSAASWSRIRSRRSRGKSSRPERGEPLAKGEPRHQSEVEQDAQDHRSASSRPTEAATLVPRSGAAVKCAVPDAGHPAGSPSQGNSFPSSGTREGPRHACYPRDRKSTRLNSSHVSISYAVFCLKKKTNQPPAALGSARASPATLSSVRIDLVGAGPCRLRTGTLVWREWVEGLRRLVGRQHRQSS